MIEVKNLSKKFKDVDAVKKVSFQVNKGTVFGLLGENGAGKTTTLRMLATMLKPTNGTAKLNGVDLVTDPEGVRGQIGILFGGETGLYDRLSARENIEYFGLLNGMDKRKIESRINTLSTMLDMDDYIDRRAGKFSKGMKQKVSIARSIVHDPNIMLFDEPTSGLDVTAVRLVHDFIRKIKDQGKTIIFSSHSMNEVEKLCDVVGIIHKGEIIEIATIEELKNKYENMALEDIFIRLVGGQNE
ncbi:ATP-binding cassette domain-containing protein [Dethiothermospora halolimnae]|uniref:ABC transporter ATP-binding protein n=1 Tax=Dethiothermospora halolimnae TaxID=3114390 RepID=UPI003CCB7CE0